jgi:bifunctional DNA-binding transcriptional regulator/antitoxin component of YhaV-PrlF toxin-antitoxin module
MTTNHQVYNNGWKALNKIEESMSDLLVFNRLLDMALDALESSREDEVMNSLIAARQYLGYFEKTFDVNFRTAWDAIIPNLREKAASSPRAYFSSVDEEGFLTLPEEVLEREGWVEGTKLNVEVGDDGQSLVITRAPDDEDETTYPGCMGDELTDKEKDALRNEGLRGFFKLDSPW